jgi:hypothetical protein
MSNPVSSETQRDLLDKLRKSFKNIKDGEVGIKNLKQFVDTVEEVKANLKTLHIDVSDLYIRLSLFNTIPNKNDLAVLDDDGTFENLLETLQVYPDVSYLSDEMFSGMLNATTKGGSIYEKVEGKDSGAISKLKNIVVMNLMGCDPNLFKTLPKEFQDEFDSEVHAEQFYVNKNN